MHDPLAIATDGLLENNSLSFASRGYLTIIVETVIPITPIRPVEKPKRGGVRVIKIVNREPEKLDLSKFNKNKKKQKEFSEEEDIEIITKILSKVCL